MYKLRSSMFTETSHFLPGHPGACANMHGHSYKWTVEVGSQMLINDMVMDFAHLKLLMNDIIGPYDHALVVESAVWHEAAANVFEYMNVMRFSHRPTAERMARAVYAEFYDKLPKSVIILSVTCRETENNEAVYTEP